MNRLVLLRIKNPGTGQQVVKLVQGRVGADGKTRVARHIRDNMIAQVARPGELIHT